MTQSTELKAILNSIEATAYSDIQSIEKLLDYGFRLQQWMAFSGEQVSIAKELLHKKRRQAYINLIASMESQAKKVGPMLMKDYINDCCAEENSNYELADRCNRTCVHGIDLVRTAISALKTEIANMNYANHA